MARKPPNPALKALLFLFIGLLIVAQLSDTAEAVKSEYLTPAARRFRRRLELAKRKELASRSVRRTPTPPPVSRPASPLTSLHDVKTAFSHSKRARKFKPRQIDNTSCNNITITPPGFDGSCSIAQPCPNGACCGESNFCGYGDEFCGDGCTSNCDAVAECGPNAAPGHEECPLNVCCSKFGFCGSTDDFCGDNCVGKHCGSPSIPTGVNSAVTSRLIGYYEGWASGRVCDQWFPDNIPSAGYTHLNYAFASIDPNTFAVVPASSSDVPQYTAFTNLKQSNPTLKTFISVGGWSFNDPPTQHVFSDMSSTESNRQAFATSLVNFMVNYGFDGVDIDWEYPVACERGGVPADTANMVAMFKTLRETFSASGHTFGISFTAPSSYWYLQHFDLLGLLTYADWVNLMSYDLHGVWDAKDVFIGNIVQAHTNLTEIEQSVQLFQRVGVPLDRIVLGLGFYGRSFQLSDPSCSKPGCPFNGPAPGGPCTAADGTLSFAEIQDVLARSGSTPVYDKDAQVKYLVYDTNNWVSYDDKDTFSAKVDFARGAGFGGLMALSAVLGKNASDIIPKSQDLNSKDGKQCMQPGCGQSCPSGYVQMTDVTDGKLANPQSGCAKHTGNPVCLHAHVLIHMPICIGSNQGGTGKKCSSGHKAFCCESGLTEDQIERATNCQCCNDNVCPPGTFTKDRDYYGDTNIFHACIMQEKSLCCQPPDGATTTSPFNVDDLFPNPPENGDLSWDLQDDPIDENAPNGGADADDNSFGLIAMDGPSNLLSSIAPSSDWVVLGCTGETTGIQNVVAFCKKAENDSSSGCSAVFEGGAQNTIVKLPSGCGGPYARLHSLQVNDSLALPESHAAMKPASNPVYDLQFDFEFGRMSETRAASDGEVLLRVDATTLPGYWAEIDTADPNSNARRELEERWFGAFKDWLSRLNKVKSNTKADLGMSKSFQSVLYSASQSCASDDGTTTFASSISLTAQGGAEYNVEYGFYLEGTIFPPGINQAYVYVSSHGQATVGLTLTGRASASYNSGKIPIIPPVYWPGLSYPGIVSIGPSLNIYGQLQGSLTLSGTIGATVTYPLPESHVSLGITGNNPDQSDESPQVNVDNMPATFNVAPTFDVSLSGSLSVHAIPEASLVFDLLPNTIVHVNARAYIALDGSVTVSFDADLSSVDARVDAAIDATAGVEATAGSQYTLGPFSIYHNSINLYHQTLTLGGSQSRRRSLPYYAKFVESGVFADYPEYLYEGESRNSTSLSYTPFGHTFDKRSIISGTLTCPKTVDDGSATCDQQLADDDIADADPDDTSDELFRRSLGFEEFEDSHTLEKRVKVIGYYKGTTINGWWHFFQPNTPTSYVATNNGQNVPGAKWAREHVYEDVIQRDLNQFLVTNDNFCSWIQRFVFKSVQFGPNTKFQLSALLAATEPSGNDLMPAFISGKRKFRKKSTLQNADPGNVLYLLRSAAHSVSYMNSQPIQTEFTRVARLVEQRWVDFFQLYNTVAGTNYDVRTAYQYGILAGYGPNANAFFSDAVSVLQAQLNAAPGGSTMVGVPKNCNNPKVPFDLNMLGTLVNSLPTGGLTWTYP
ncbi:hypothetical protein OH77DRAFT_1430947 [Trametes cingulata]|nr:hypothetical protein OH77DRAFT_1430947 [Trametes cingulata]